MPGKLAIEIDGKVVRVEISCKDHYEAIELYEQMTLAAREGSFNLEMNLFVEE